MVIADDSAFLVNGMRAVGKKNRYFSFLLEELKDNGSKTSSIFLIILSMYVCIIILSTDIQEHEFKSWSDFVSWKENVKAESLSSFQQSTQAKYSNKGICCNNRWNSREFNFNKILTNK